ncbi:hypothetical protein ES703_108286 [subsurface metagenome]
MRNFTPLNSDIQVAIVFGLRIILKVDRETYDQSIELLRKAINKTKLGIREKNEALNRLNRVRC